NLLYVGTGNPAPWIADMRRGENLYTMSAVALDVDSGKMKWYHQYLANEPWDFDTMAEHHVIDVVRGGQTHKAVVQANKLGYVYTLDRITGKFLSAVPFAKSVTWGGRSRHRQGRGESRAAADDGRASGGGLSVA